MTLFRRRTTNDGRRTTDDGLRRQLGLWCQRGSAMVEFCVCGVLFFTLTFGVIEASRVIYQYNIVASAARDGARWAIVRGLESGPGRIATALQIQTYVRTRDLGRNSTVNVSWSPNNAPGSIVQVQVSQPFTSIVPYSMIGGMTISSTARMTIMR